jgi:hypothetical protein
MVKMRRGRRVGEMITVDIPADLNAEDQTGYVWAFLDEVRDPSVVVPGALVIAGDADAPRGSRRGRSRATPQRHDYSYLALARRIATAA